MTENKLPIKEEIFFNLPIGAGMSIFYLEIVFTIVEGGMVTINELLLDEISLSTLDKPKVKQFNTLWEPVYSLYNPNEINESVTEIDKLVLINQNIIFETLHYFSMAAYTATAKAAAPLVYI
jgi:hypothetical protein